jgi:hypothetical protein
VRRRDIRARPAKLALTLDHPLGQVRRDLLELTVPPPAPRELDHARLQLELPLSEQPLGTGYPLVRVLDRRVASRDRLIDLPGAVAEQGPLEATLADPRRLGR